MHDILFNHHKCMNEICISLDKSGTCIKTNKPGYSINAFQQGHSISYRIACVPSEVSDRLQADSEDDDQPAD